MDVLSRTAFVLIKRDSLYTADFGLSATSPMWFADTDERVLEDETQRTRPPTCYVNSVGAAGGFHRGRRAGAPRRSDGRRVLACTRPARTKPDGLARPGGPATRRVTVADCLARSDRTRSVGGVDRGRSGRGRRVARACAIAAAFRLAPTGAAWFWHCRRRPTGDADRSSWTSLLTQDPALAPHAAVRTNEYYVSQYLDLTPVTMPGHGTALAVRQNMPGRAGAVGCCVGRPRRGGPAGHRRPPAPERSRRPAVRATSPAHRLQHEHTMVGAPGRPSMPLAPGGRRDTGFYGSGDPGPPGRDDRRETPLRRRRRWPSPAAAPDVAGTRHPPMRPAWPTERSLAVHQRADLRRH